MIAVGTDVAIAHFSFSYPSEGQGVEHTVLE